MNMHRFMSCCLVVLIAGLLAAPAAWAKGGMDDGLLDPAWFKTAGEFRKTDAVDYLWVKPGFEVRGHTLKIDAWQDHDFLGKKRDAKDAAKAAELTEMMPSRLRGALAAELDGVATVSRESGDLIVTGRFVDCNAGSKAAKLLVGMGAGSAAATWDIKITDAATGELLVAAHHRVISGTALSEIDDKIAKWLEKFGHALAGRLQAEYTVGKPAKK